MQLNVWVTCRIPCRKCELCLAGRDNLCLKEGYFGLDIPGGYAEYVAVPIANLNALPAQVRFEDAAAAQIAARLPDTAIVMLTVSDSDEDLFAEASRQPVGRGAADPSEPEHNRPKVAHSSWSPM